MNPLPSAHLLGPLEGEYRLDQGLIPPLVVVGFLLLAVGVGTFFASPEPMGTPVGIGLAFAVFGGLCLLAALRVLVAARTVRVHEEGFVLSRGRRAEAYPFDQVTAWSWSGRRPYRLRVRSGGRRPLTLFAHSPSGLATIASRLEELGPPATPSHRS